MTLVKTLKRLGGELREGKLGPSTGTSLFRQFADHHTTQALPTFLQHASFPLFELKKGKMRVI